MSDFVQGLDDAIGKAEVLSSPNEMALAAILFIEKTGHRIVPVEPTEDMQQAGYAALSRSDGSLSQGARDVFNAMLVAAPAIKKT